MPRCMATKAGKHSRLASKHSIQLKIMYLPVKGQIRASKPANRRHGRKQEGRKEMHSGYTCILSNTEFKHNFCLFTRKLPRAPFHFDMVCQKTKLNP